MSKTKHIVWSNLHLDLDDWRDDLLDAYPDVSPSDESALYGLMEEENAALLEDERLNLDIRLTEPILVIADLGLWDGRRPAYKEIPSGNVRDCLYDNNDYTEWYVDGHGNLRATSVHHDGTNTLLYRVWKDGVSDARRERLKWKITHGQATAQDIAAVTRSIGKEISRVYGWN